MESHNLDCLTKLLCYPPNKSLGLKGINKKDVSDWYDTDFRQNTLGYDYGLRLKDTQKDQGGGGIGVEEFKIDGRNYLFKINYSEAELIPIQHDDGEVETIKTEARVHFISLLDIQHSNNFACIYLIIYSDQKYALIQGFTNKFLCSGYRIGEKINLLPKTGQGYYLMNGLIQYCYKYQSMLGIERLELNDQSYYECKPSFNIDLVYSNILCGKLPYYMRFGFQPIEKSAIIKIKNNLDQISKIVVNADFQELLREISEISIPRQVLEIVKMNLGNPVSKCLTEILHNNCLFFYHIYMKLWRKWRLKEFDGDETAYELYL